MNYFKPNWYQIDKTIKEGNIKELRKEQKSLEKSIQKKIDQYYRDQKDKKSLEHIARIKSLPSGAPLYFTGYDSKGKIKFGDKFTKTTDGRTYVHAKLTGTDVIWRLPYNWVIDRECTDQEIHNRKLEEKISKVFNDIMNI